MDLDYLVAARTPPGHSWKNPVERIMSILNLGLQCIGLMRKEMISEFEELMNKCNSMADIRRLAEEKSQLKLELSNSLAPTIDLMENIFERLNLKDEPFSTYKAASENEIEELWNSLLTVDENLSINDRTKNDIKNKVSYFFYFNLLLRYILTYN